jgi:hypothetical protein
MNNPDAIRHPFDVVQVDVENANEQNRRKNSGTYSENRNEETEDDPSGCRGQRYYGFVSNGVDDALDCVGSLSGPITLDGRGGYFALAEEHEETLPGLIWIEVQIKKCESVGEDYFGCGELVA